MTDTTGPGQTLNALRRRAPLVHNITNLVAMDIATNLLLAAGALPAMIHNAQEVRDVVAEADALTINIGTLSANWLEPMVAAARTAVDLGKPWVLDPVGGDGRWSCVPGSKRSSWLWGQTWRARLAMVTVEAGR